MLFNSYEFIFLFLPITFIIFFLIAGRSQKGAVAWMVLASLFFYGWWDYRYVPLLLGSILFNYFIGTRIETVGSKKAWLTAGIAGNLLLLGYFKYAGFFIENLNTVFDTGLVAPQVMLPLGISFFTFTQSAYLIDAYRGETKHDNIFTYLEFVTVFPHLIAGPIISHREMMPQFKLAENYKINYQNIALGLTLFIMGLFKKVVIADGFAPWVNNVFSRVDSLTTIEAWIGALGYSFQLYFDFSGYSEMAIGLAMMFNLRFPVNFNSPYQAENIIEFWRRWHMTLGTWVKHYLYIPLGGNRTGEVRKMLNLFFSMLLIGLWHGAGWTFIFWGALHGVFLMINHAWKKMDIYFPLAAGRVLTFLCVMVAWIFFRAESFTDAVKLISVMLDWHRIALLEGTRWQANFGFLTDYGVSFIPWLMRTKLDTILLNMAGWGALVFFCPNPQRLMEKFRPSWRWLAVCTVMMLTVLTMMTRISDFLYFQF